MKYAMLVEAELLKRGFRVEQNDITGGERLDLGVGAVITIYDNGTVMVQGKLNPKYKAWALRNLKQVLPVSTRWLNK